MDTQSDEVKNSILSAEENREPGGETNDKQKEVNKSSVSETVQTAAAAALAAAAVKAKVTLKILFSDFRTWWCSDPWSLFAATCKIISIDVEQVF